MNIDQNSPPDYRGYSPEKWVDMHTQSTSLLQEAVVTLAPFGGLSANELAHLRSDWITWKEDFVTIRIPKTAECNEWKLGGGIHGKPQLNQRDSPCHYCKAEGNTDSFENLWKGENGSEPRQYTATLHRDLAEPAVDLLTKVFKTWDRPEIAAAPNGLWQAVNYVTEDESNFNYSRLLHTGVVLYCHYGLSQADIADLTPYTKSTVRQIEAATPEITRKQNNSYTYLRAVAADEPVSVATLAEQLEVTTPAVRGVLKRLEKEGRVKSNRDGHAHMWETVGDWTQPFTCDVCGDTVPTLQGIRTHRSKKH